MTVIYKKRNNQFIASYTDRQGYKTNFGPYPIKLSMILAVHEHFNQAKKQVPEIMEQPWKSLMINDIDYGKLLYDVSLKIEREREQKEWLQYSHDLMKNKGVFLINPLDNPFLNVIKH